eukprot:scaffold25249_cov19-Tisochrysis_lutea.AAC.1
MPESGLVSLGSAPWRRSASAISRVCGSARQANMRGVQPLLPLGARVEVGAVLEQELGAVDGSGLASDHEGGAFAGRRVGGGFRLEEQRGASLVVGDAGVHEGRPVGLVGVGAGVEELAHARVVPVGGREEEGGHAGVVLDVG